MLLGEWVWYNDLSQIVQCIHSYVLCIINSGGIKWRILYVMEIFYIRKV